MSMVIEEAFLIPHKQAQSPQEERRGEERRWSPRTCGFYGPAPDAPQPGESEESSWAAAPEDTFIFS